MVGTDTVAALEQAIRRGDADAARALGADGSVSGTLEVLATNARRIGLGGLGLNYLGETGEVSGDGWTARVEVTWRYRGFDDAAGRADIAVTFSDGGETIATLAPYGAGMPLWLGGPVGVRRTQDTLVVTTGPARWLDRYEAQAREAVGTVSAVLDRPTRLVVEVPGTVEELNRAVAAEPGTYDAIAAVTAGLDGIQAPGNPVHVFINPAVFGSLDDVAAQVVMTHEATHVVTDAPFADADLWLLEGFADYVALRDTTLPVQRTAGQIIEQVQRHGVPTMLPLPTDFDSQAQHLGAVYEAAWLICVVLAERGGEEGLVSFYDAVVDGAILEEELQRTFGWSLDDLTAAWQARLAQLAGVPDSPGA